MTTVTGRELARDYLKILQRVAAGEVIGIIAESKVLAVLHSPKLFEITKATEQVSITAEKLCEIKDFAGPGAKACTLRGTIEWISPVGFQFPGEKFILCDKHFAQVAP